MKKLLSVCSAAVLAVTTLFSSSVISASASTESTYTFRFETDRSFISTEEIEAGDVVISGKVYISGSTENTFTAARARFNSDSPNIRFQNLYASTGTTETKQTYTYSQGSFTTTWIPYCFGKTKNGVYDKNTMMETLTNTAYDPVFGSTLYSGGDGTIYFTKSNYKESSDAEASLKTFTCEVTENEDGSGSYVLNYVDQSVSGSYAPKTAYGTIRDYASAFLEAGTAIPGYSNSVVWNSNSLSDGSSFLGETADEFPFCYVDVVVKQGTPSGMYAIDFEECQLVSPTTSCRYEMEGAAIIVGDIESVSITDVEQEDIAYYYSQDTDSIQASDFAYSILADITYADGTVEIGVNIAPLVDCNGITPSELYNSVAGSKSEKYSSDQVSLYLNGEALRGSDGTLLTQNICVVMRGDVDLNGEVTLNDAYLALIAYANGAVGNETDLTEIQSFAADVEDDDAITLNDAFVILCYYANHAVNNDVSWESLL